jgi:hypothetical protein
VPTIPGWIEQWYGKLPADGNVVLNVPPGAIVPDVHAPVFETELCATESLFIQVTVPPTATVTGFGENAVVVSVDDPETMDTGMPDVGAVVDGEDELHAEARVNTKMASAVRTIMKTSCVDRSQSCCLIRRCDSRSSNAAITQEKANDGLRTAPSGFRRS